MCEELQILWVDDDIRSLRKHITSLETENVFVTTASTTAGGLNQLETNSFSIVITDLLMPPPSSGLDFIEKVHEKYPETKIIVISGWLENDEYRKGLRWLENDMGIDLIEKPLPEPDSDAFNRTKKRILSGKIPPSIREQKDNDVTIKLQPHAKKTSKKNTKSWLTTIPVAFTSIAGLITAIAALIVALNKVGIF